MLQRFSKLITASGMAAALAVGAIPKPAAADTQSTLNTALGAAALLGGIILYENYQHRQQAANTIVGYTRNGGTVYGDGRIVLANGQTIYPNSDGQYPWGQQAYYDQNANGYAYDYNRTGQFDTTHRHDGNWQNANRANWQNANAANWQNRNADRAAWQNQNANRTNWQNQNADRAAWQNQNANRANWQNRTDNRRDDQRDDRHDRH